MCKILKWYNLVKTPRARYTSYAFTSMTTISHETVRAVAKLARLGVTDAEVEAYAKELSVIFSYVEELNTVDTSTVSETVQVTGLEDVTRPDEAALTKSDVRQKLLDAFPEKHADLLRVKAVFTE